jgi:hypothetical protein
MNELTISFRAEDQEAEPKSEVISEKTFGHLFH